MNVESKFNAILDRRRDGGEEGKEEQKKIEQTAKSTSARKKRAGRPNGKRTNPNYGQVTAYIPKTLHEEVKIALIKEGRKEFSTLVEELLSEWMQNKKSLSSGSRRAVKN